MWGWDRDSLLPQCVATLYHNHRQPALSFVDEMHVGFRSLFLSLPSHSLSLFLSLFHSLSLSLFIPFFFRPSSAIVSRDHAHATTTYYTRTATAACSLEISCFVSVEVSVRFSVTSCALQSFWHSRCVPSMTFLAIVIFHDLASN